MTNNEDNLISFAKDRARLNNELLRAGVRLDEWFIENEKLGRAEGPQLQQLEDLLKARRQLLADLLALDDRFANYVAEQRKAGVALEAARLLPPGEGYLISFARERARLNIRLVHAGINLDSWFLSNEDLRKVSMRNLGQLEGLLQERRQLLSDLLDLDDRLMERLVTRRKPDDI